MVVVTAVVVAGDEGYGSVTVLDGGVWVVGLCGSGDDVDCGLVVGVVDVVVAVAVAADEGVG